MPDSNPISGLLSDEDLEAIDKRHEAATPGPWTLRDDVVVAPGRGMVSRDSASLDDATFIAAARTDVPRLVAHVRHLNDRLEASRVNALRARDAYEASIAAMGEERERLRTLVVRAQLVAGYVGRVPSSEGHQRAHRLQEDIMAYLVEVTA